MKRLEKHQIRDIKVRLAEWQAPQAMHDVVEASMNSLGSCNLFNQAGLDFLRDAWIAAKFSSLRNAEKVRLVLDDWPDFEFVVGGRTEVFEAVEADDVNRRRGEEYRHGVGESEDDPVEDWNARAKQAGKWIREACHKKLGKRYGDRVNLVIYLNLNEFGVQQHQVESCFSHSTEEVKDAFETVWILWKQRAYEVWPHG